ncbi:calcineurin-binding protein cabin-1-like isoform X2 [Lycorma delicatula]|uniref:calcineurin-binding protein cabin-1-like isoform X2 n=1 Tax=Lycorma delicatula TaxID=130591 RepID=UPI003F5184BD
MTLAHFKALNVSSSEESDGDVENPPVTREALEEKAVSEYTKVLLLQRNKQWKEAEEGLKKLLESDVLSRVTGNVNYVGGKLQPSLVHLKYCILVNLGHVLTEMNEIKAAVDYYLEAVMLDDTDLNLWYRIGRAAIKIPNLNLASYAFQEALRCNPNHWPSLDTLITVLYASGNFLLCLYYISEGLEKDCKFMKGIAFCQKIYDDHPYFRHDFQLYYPQCLLDEKIKEYGKEIKTDDPVYIKMFEEANRLKKSFETLQWPRENKDEVLSNIKPDRPLKKKSWIALGRCLLHVYNRLKEDYPEISFYRLVDLTEDDVVLTKPDVDTVETEDFLDDNLIDKEIGKMNELPGDNEDTGGRNKRRRSSPSLLDQLMSCSKRRSARVRSTVRRDEPTLARTLHNLLPQSLRPSKDDRRDLDPLRCSEDSMDTMDLYRLFESKDGISLQENNEQYEVVNNVTDDERNRLIEGEKYFNTDKEINDINKFIKENNCHNILIFLNNYVRSVSSKWKLWWPSYLNTVYLKIYKIVRLHSPENCQTSETLDMPGAQAVLLYGELLLDYWLQKGKEQGLPSPITGSVFGGEFCTLSFGDLNYVCDDSEDNEFIVRCYWLEAVMYLHAGNSESTLIVLQRFMDDSKCGNIEVKLNNIKNHHIINFDLIERLYNTLKRNESLSKVQTLFIDKKYSTVAEILMEALQPSARLLNAEFVEPVLDRCTQFSLLLDSLFELEKYEDCFIWCELCCHEALNNCRNSLEDDGNRSKWLILLTNALQALPFCIDHGSLGIIGKLPNNKLVRLIQTLSSVVSHQIESSDSAEIPFETISPWILLYEILKHYEETSGKIIEDDEIPNSLTLLFTAHEYLGRRNWCCYDEAEILLKTLKVLLPIMESSNPDSDKMLILNQQMEQIFYCLYGHPIKKNRPRYVQEHNANGLALTWSRSWLVYRFLKPRELPMYDSSARYSISQDTEAFFRRIVDSIPNENNPSSLVEQLNSYIEGTSNELPMNKKLLPNEIVDIYYLIADYYFKNKSWSKAIKYYVLDVCANPKRVDSWACLALARGSQLETKLNSCERIKSETEFLKRAKMSCKCYQRSLQLDPEQSTLWIEYGSFSYMVHSFCSRLLNQEQNLSLELFEILETQKDEMLGTAFTCFTSANTLWSRYEKMGIEPEIQDERWLHHYMLGKIAEKREEKPIVYLNHFMQAVKFLHQNNAKYPEHISYSNPQLYSVEALELYYRIHACILKSVEQSEDQPLTEDLRQYFYEVLEKSACGPFANFGEPLDYIYNCDASDEKSMLCLTENEAKFVMDRILIKISGEYSDSTNKRKVSSSDYTEENIEETNPKKFKTNDYDVGTDGEITRDSNNKKILQRQGSKESDSANDSKNETSDDMTDKSDDGKRTSKTVKSQDSSSETLSDTSSSDSDSSEDTTSSEESDSSSSESSQQDSSDDDDDDDKPSPAKKMKTNDVKTNSNWKEEQRCLIDRCLIAMEECVIRFPEHYKSIYRQAHYYFRSKVRSDNVKVEKLLLGEGGLFADRKPNHFFNGVWRIPSSEIDRPGSFAGHMSRCLHLLLDLLRDSRDHKMLFTLSLQLKDTPDPDKKYLRDEEREQLAKESLTLSVQALRRKLHETHNTTEIQDILNDAYRRYKRISKFWPRDAAFISLVTQCFSKYLKSKGENCKSTFEAAIRFCQDGTLIPVTVPEQSISVPEQVLAAPSTQQSQVLTVTPTTTAVTVAASVTSAPATVTMASSINLPPIVTTPPIVKATATPVQNTQIPVKRPRGRPAGSSIRHPNPLSQILKNMPSMSKDFQMFYKNLPYNTPQQLMNIMRTNPMFAMHAASLTVQQQFNNLQAELMRQITIAQGSQKSSQMPSASVPSTNKSSTVTTNISATTSPKDHPNITITAISPSAKSSTSSSGVQSHQRSTVKSKSKSMKPQLSATVTPVITPRETQTIPSVSKSQIVCSPSIIKNPNNPFNPVPLPSNIRHPMTSSPLNSVGSDISLQHKLLSAKRSKQASISSIKETDLASTSRFDNKDKPSHAIGKNIIDMAKNATDNKFNLAAGPSGLSISKIPSKITSASCEQKQLPKEIGLTISTVNNELSSKLSSLSPKEITLTRLPQNENQTGSPTIMGSNIVNSMPDKVMVSYTENTISSKNKQLNLSQRQQDLPQIQQHISSNLPGSYRKPVTAVDNRISALKAIGTQLTITQAHTNMPNVDNKKQDVGNKKQDVGKYDKADVTIVATPKDKQKKDSCEVIFLE